MLYQGSIHYPVGKLVLKYSVVPVIFTGYVWRHWRTSTNVFTISWLSIEPPPPPSKFSSTALLQSFAKSLLHYSSTIRRLFADYCTIRRLFADYSYYSRTIRTIRRLFADYSYYSSTIRGLFVLFVDYSQTIRTIRRLFVLFVDYSHYSLHYSSFINCLKFCGS
jgi:hypothetical protein